MRSKLVRGATWALAIKSAGLGLAFAVQVVLARALGPSGFGSYALTLGWLSVLALLGKLGMEAAAQRFVPQYRTQSHPALLHGFLRASRRWTLAGSSAVALAAIGVVLLLRQRLQPSTSGALLIGLATIPLFARLQLASGLLQAARRVVASQAPLLVGVPLLTLAGLFIVFGPLDLRPDPRTALLVFAASVTVCLVVTEVSVRRALPAPVDAPAEDRSAWFSVGVSLLLAGGFGALLAYADVLMLGILAGTEQTGLYSAASRLARLVELPLMAVNVIAAPLISELHYGQQRDRLRRLARNSTLVVIALTLPLVVVLFFFGAEILGVFGEEFARAETALAVLLVGRLVSAALGPVGHLLGLTGGHRATAFVLGISALANVGLNALLIPRHGLLGAAVATATTTAFWNIAMYAMVRRRLGLRPFSSRSRA